LGAVLMSSPIEVERRVARRVEELGFRSLWTGETVGGKEAFAHQGVLLAATERLVTGTGIANLWSRAPAAMQGGAATLGAAYPGRFLLGVGVSHSSIVKPSGQSYENPLEKMRGYLDGMDASASYAPRTEIPVPRLLAALRPKMLAVARERADGAHPYLVPVEHTALARQALGPDKLLIPEQALILEPDAAEARRIGRGHVCRYLELPNYVNHLRRLGFRDDDFEGGGSDRLVDAIVVWGDEDAVARRVVEHHQNGADHVLIQPLGDMAAAMAQLERLSPMLLAAS
jgi:probable F420-dependent oxidoreductase